MKDFFKLIWNVWVLFAHDVLLFKNNYFIPVGIAFWFAYVICAALSIYAIIVIIKS